MTVTEKAKIFRTTTRLGPTWFLTCPCGLIVHRPSFAGIVSRADEHYRACFWVKARRRRAWAGW